MVKQTSPDPSPQRDITPRQAVLQALSEKPLSALEISGLAGVSEKSVYDLLEHLVHDKKHGVAIQPAECRVCGYRFVKRDKVGKPGKCPQCRERRIAAPRFYLKK